MLNEALDARVPLLERLKFLAIFSANLDEFYMVRVGGLRRKVADGVILQPPDCLPPRRQLARSDAWSPAARRLQRECLDDLLAAARAARRAAGRA